MRHIHILLGAMVGAVAFAGNARGELIIGGPVTAPYDNAMATVQFLGQEAAYTGDLYFLGWGDETTVTEWSTSTDGTGLGQWLANNHSTTIGDTSALDGSFSAGAVLHFAYNVTEVTEPPDGIATYRTDDRNEGYRHFAWDAATGGFRVEDLPFYESDFDYNDAMFSIEFEMVPAPGALALLGLGGLVTRRRR